MFAAGEISRIEGLTSKVTNDPVGVPLRVTVIYKDATAVLEQAYSGATQVVALNLPPVITSNRGGATAVVSLSENSTAVTTVRATDADPGDVVTFSIAGGPDATKFTINSTTGALAFISAPDFETPRSAAGNNTYNVIVQAPDAILVDSQLITVNVINLNDSAPVVTSAAAFSRTENSTAVTTVTATDPDHLTTTFAFSPASLLSIP